MTSASSTPGASDLHGRGGVLPAAVAVVSTLFSAGLWAASYPTWRVVLVTMLLFSMIPGTLPTSLGARVRGDRPTLLPLIATLTHLGIVVLTGGLHSPFLVALIGPFTGLFQSFGVSLISLGALGLVTVGAAVMAHLPSEWFGPLVAAPWDGLLTALTLIATGTINAWLFLLMGKALAGSHEEIVRARTEMATHALARARELEQLGAQLSHELKNPLGIIKALVQLSERDTAHEKSAERLRVASAEILRMEGVLRDHLTFSRPFARLKPQPVMLGDLADEVLRILSVRAQSAGVTLQRTGDGAADADPACLREALFNLVINGVTATPPGGVVRVEIEGQERRVLLRVRDSGRGMSPLVLEKVGTPFFTTREDGTGLGVALARAAFVQHGGSLEYSSEEGRGTIAVGELPLRHREGGMDGAAAARG